MKKLTLTVYYSSVNSGWIIKQDKHVAAFAWKGLATLIEDTLAVMGFRFTHARGKGEWRVVMPTRADLERADALHVVIDMEGRMKRFAARITGLVPDGVLVLFSPNGKSGGAVVPAEPVPESPMLPKSEGTKAKPGMKIAIGLLHLAYTKAVYDVAEARARRDELKSAIDKLGGS
jgi:hypothetical protein